MKILVANLGSTSFKYRLFDFSDGRELMLAKGGFDRVSDYAACIETTLKDLLDGGHLASEEDLAAVGFKTILGGEISGCVRADDTVLAALDRFSTVAPAHNPPYAAGIRQFQKRLPSVPTVALFETAFYAWAHPASRNFAVPKEWREAGLRRYGYHGASHKFIAERSAELLGREELARGVRHLYQAGPPEVSEPCRVISCHLGGSSSITAIRNGVAFDSTMGFSPQSGLPQNNRVGDLDSMAFPFLIKTLGLSPDAIEQSLSKEGGLLALSGVSNDMRDIEAAANEGNADAKLAIDTYIYAIRHYIGAFAAQMGGIDALAFTGGIGENNDWLREAICRDFDLLNLKIDPAKNKGTRDEADISAAGSAAIYIIPANEELVVARETQRLLQ
ncbi:MAG: acetate/propionate family kinase [Verrucomicrobiota bacterium]